MADQEYINAINHSLTDLGRIEQITRLKEQNAALRDALRSINSCSCDAGEPKGKQGSDWIAAICREISEKALSENGGG